MLEELYVVYFHPLLGIKLLSILFSKFYGPFRSKDLETAFGILLESELRGRMVCEELIVSNICLLFVTRHFGTTMLLAFARTR